MLIEENTNHGGLENVRDRASQYGRVDDVSDEGKELEKAVRVEGGRKGVKFTGFERHGLYGLQDFFLRDRAER